MGYPLPTVSDFKAQFPRDFPYGVPAWGGAGKITLVNGVITAVAVLAGGFGYATQPDVVAVDRTGSGAVLAATVDKGKITGFTVTNGGTGYSADVTLAITGGAGSPANFDLVQDFDIAGAFQDAGFNVNQELFSSAPDFQRAFNYLAAHMLVEKLLMAGEGLASQYNWLTTSKGVGDVSEAFQIPERIAKDPMLSAFSKTRYGAAYLQIISPLLIGNMATQFRQSLP